MDLVSKNSKKYLLLCHLIFVTKYRRKIFYIKELNNFVIDYFKNLEKDFLILEQETDQNHIHFMIQYEPELSISMIVRFLKQKSTIDIWKKHNRILKIFYIFS